MYRAPLTFSILNGGALKISDKIPIYFVQNSELAQLIAGSVGVESRENVQVIDSRFKNAYSTTLILESEKNEKTSPLV